MLPLVNTTPSTYIDTTWLFLPLPPWTWQFWCASSSHYAHIDSLVMFCFAGRDQTEPPSFVFIGIQTESGWSAISFWHSVTVLVLLNRWILIRMSICWSLLMCLHMALRWLFSNASTRCDSINSVSSHSSINHCFHYSWKFKNIILSSITADCSYPFLLVLFLGNETDLNMSQH